MAEHVLDLCAEDLTPAETDRLRSLSFDSPKEAPVPILLEDLEGKYYYLRKTTVSLVRTVALQGIELERQRLIIDELCVRMRNQKRKARPTAESPSVLSDQKRFKVLSGS